MSRVFAFCSNSQPDNRDLVPFPSRRVSAECVRDASTHNRWMRSALASALLVFTVGCTGFDNGPPEPEPEVFCEGEGDLAIEPGKTGIDFESFAEGDILPTWDRIQGGIGTRINVKLSGVTLGAVRAGQIDFLQTIILFPLPGPPGGVGENGGDCSIDLEGNQVCGTENLSCVIGKCREVITDQVNRQFPGECIDGKVVVTEMPIRFRTRVELSEVDGKVGELMMRLDVDDSDDEFVLSEPVEIEMDVVEFIRPSWWED